MRTDPRATSGHAGVAAEFERIFAPGSGGLVSVGDVDPAPDGRRVAFTGCALPSLDSAMSSRIHVASLPPSGVDAHGHVAVDAPVAVTAGPSDRFPRWSPDGRSLTFLSARDAGRDRLHVLHADGWPGEARLVADVGGTVEWSAWSPDGTQVLVGVAGCGADRGGAFGSGTTPSDVADAPAWLPDVQVAAPADAWRRAWAVDVASGAAVEVSPPGLNVWEACWAGPDALLAVVSDDPGEGAWYAARLVVLAVDGGARPRVVLPGAVDAAGVQIALPAASPSGRGLAAVRSVCSDRGLVAGDLVVSVDAGATFDDVDTNGIDVSALSWLDEERIGLLGVRGLETVTAVASFADGAWAVTETWSAFEAVGPRCGEARFLADGSAVGVVESWERPPAVAALGAAGVAVATTTSFDVSSLPGSAEGITWVVDDGLEIEGILVRPSGAGPHPTLLYVHGGPVYCWRNRWMQTGPLVPLLVERGVAVLMPNPRGSSGRGQAFARPVVGDMGGADTVDLLSGLDALVERGIADSGRLAVTGLSYGGFMSSWLVTRTPRFAAAIPMSPCTDWWSQHYGSNIGAWDSWFMGGSPEDVTGPYGTRSPIVHADAVTTPCLFVAGALDKCTPPTQATEFHRALRGRGVESTCVIYPEEGHGVAAMPARIDLVARQLDFLTRHLSLT